MKTLRCCIIDNDPARREALAALAAQNPMLDTIGIFANATDAVRTVVNGDPALVILGLPTPEFTGLDFARVIPAGCALVVAADTDRFALDAIRAQAVDYLTAPIARAPFAEAVARAADRWLKERRRDSPDTAARFIVVKSDYKLLHLPVDDITFIEGLKDYVRIHLADQRSIMSLMSLKTLEHYLPQPQFMRVHRSYMVNTCQVRVIDRNGLTFGMRHVPVGESYRDALNQYLARHTPQAIND